MLGCSPGFGDGEDTSVMREPHAPLTLLLLQLSGSSRSQQHRKDKLKVFLKICLYSMFMYLVCFSRRKFQKLRKVVFSSFDCESIECSLFLLLS